MTNPIISMTPAMQAHASSQIALLTREKYLKETPEGPFLLFHWVASTIDNSKDADHGPKYMRGIADRLALERMPRAQMMLTDLGKAFFISPSPLSVGKTDFLLDLNDAGQIVEVLSA